VVTSQIDHVIVGHVRSAAYKSSFLVIITVVIVTSVRRTYPCDAVEDITTLRAKSICSAVVRDGSWRGYIVAMPAATAAAAAMIALATVES